ncbi:hypothetical protein V497_00039 [Pseudogymnoascus sp. VKM F-4516 (FW-969)]|nr:hypothetical protein V497_00039 [Pseudogymnoascus sp. VKM F-4516 (FW-969)]
MLAAIRPPTSRTAHLFVGTSRAHYFTLAWDATTRRLETMHAFVDASEKHMRDAAGGEGCAVDPSGRQLCLSLFEGVLSFVKVVKPRKGAGAGSYLDEPEQIRITELFVRATVFLYTEGVSPKVAMLYQDGKDRVGLATYRVTDGRGQYGGFDPRKEREDELEVEVGASHLIPVPKGEGGQRRYVVRNNASAKAQLGGVIVVGETRMLYLDDESKATVEHVLDEASIFVAWAAYDGLRYLLGDEYGWLHLLTLVVDGEVVTGMKIEKLVRISRPSTMVCLENDLLFIGSHDGDSQVVQLDLDANTAEVVQTLDNIAPIVDFTVMDMGSRSEEARANEFSSGQARIVTGSGAFQEGGLRSVRSGVGLEDIGLLGEMDNVKGVYTLQTNNSEFQDTLVISFSTETRVFRFDSQGEVEEVEEFLGLSFEEHTLLAANVSNGRILQITPSKALLIDSESGVAVASWQPGPGEIITAAASNENYALLSADGKSLISLNLDSDLSEIARQDFGDTDQVACIDVPDTETPIGLVGLWQSGSVSIIDLRTLQPIQGDTLRNNDTAAVPRSMVLAQILPPKTSGPTLLVAMSDGVVHSYSVTPCTFALTNRKSVVLGTQQANLRVLPRADGLTNVFATCEHSSLIYSSEGRIIYSAVTAEGATFICPFNAAAYPDAIVVATASEIKISQIDTERRTHVRTLPMGETVRRVAYSPSEKVFGLGTIKRDLVNGEEIIESSFRLVDEIVFSELGKPFQLGIPQGDELVETVIRAALPNTYGLPQERFIVGTSFLDDNPALSYRGRILVFGVDSSRNPYKIAEYKVKGACRCLGVLDGKIVAALVKTVVVFEYTELSSSSAKLEKVASYRTSTCPVDLAIEGNTIAVADLMKSVSIVEYRPGTGGEAPTLVEVARHFQSVWATAVAHVDEGWLEADADGNLIVLRRNEAGVTLEDRKKMEVTGEFHLGEQVNRIRKIRVDASEDATVVPRAFLATAEGSLFLYGSVAPTSQDLLLRLQQRLAENVETPGNIPFATYRSFRNAERETEEPYRFVDGELIERFLDLDEERQEVVCKGLAKVEEVRDLVEGLRRMH